MTPNNILCFYKWLHHQITQHLFAFCKEIVAALESHFIIYVIGLRSSQTAHVDNSYHLLGLLVGDKNVAIIQDVWAQQRKVGILKETA
jgi:hypothetical protein